MWLNKATFASVLTLASLIGTTAQAAYVVTLEEEGPNVVATGSGTLDLTDLSLENNTATGRAALSSGEGFLSTGPTVETPIYLYGFFGGPADFGTGGLFFASSGSGDSVGINGSGVSLATVSVPAGYVSGSPLSDTSTYDSQTLASLGATPGVYTWTWGSGANADSFTLDIKAIPEPSTWAMMLLGFAGLGFAGYRASRKAAAVGLRP